MDKYQSWKTTEYSNKVSNKTEAEDLPEKFSLSNIKDEQCFSKVPFDSTNTVVNKEKITEVINKFNQKGKSLPFMVN